MPWHRTERDALVTALTDAGPGAPTLCTGWRTEHLAAHVVLRESAPLVAAGLGVPALAGRTERATIGLGDASASGPAYAELVARLAAGPPRWSPLRLSPDVGWLVELFVHTEDVRRAQGDVGPRALPAAQQEALWGALRRAAGALYRPAGPEVVLRSADGRRHVVAGRGGRVEVVGDPAELLLHAFGRGRASRVRVTGAPTAVAVLHRTHPR